MKITKQDGLIDDMESRIIVTDQQTISIADFTQVRLRS